MVLSISSDCFKEAMLSLAASSALRVSCSPIPVTSLTLLACKIQARRKIKKFGGTVVLEGPLSKKVFPFLSGPKIGGPDKYFQNKCGTRLYVVGIICPP